MNSKIFEELYDRWTNKKPNRHFWNQELADEFGFSSSEAIRSSFRRHRKSIEKDNRNIKLKKSSNIPFKILLYDIETSPINALVWGLWDQNIQPASIIEDWHLMSWSAKWLFDDKAYSDVLTSKEANRHDDERITKSAWKILDQADIIIAHNGDRFDNKRMNTRFLFHNLQPLSHYKSVDTLKVAKYTFSFTSNRLDYINEYLGIPQKSETEKGLWKDAYFGDKNSLESLVEYNINDVFILEELFLRLRPYIKNFPNLNVYTDELTTVCRNCGSENLNWSGYYYTNVNRYKGWRCNECGAIGRSRFSDIPRDKKKLMVT